MPAAYGTCPSCRIRRALCMNGTVRNHSPRRGSPHCAGSGRLSLREDGTDPNPAPPPPPPPTPGQRAAHALLLNAVLDALTRPTEE